MPKSNFQNIALNSALQQNIESLGYSAMTPIQEAALPSILEGQDLIGQAKTGSGKTAAFGLGILQKLDVKNFNVQSLVLCPTRELAEQVAEDIRALARTLPNIKVLVICGGIPKKLQTNSLASGIHIVIGTPGRVEEHLEQQTLKLDDLSMLVLDEADRMLDMGFQPSIDAIMQYTPSKRQTLIFSATFPKEIESISKRVMRNPKHVQIESDHIDSDIAQKFYKVNDDTHRLTATRLLLLESRPDSTVIFCNTKKDVKEVAGELKRFGFSVIALHGDLDQIDRDQALVQFANKSTSILVATDVAGRGLDIEALDLVINYHTASDPETHVHRIGRTGRAGNQGIACSLFSEKEHFKINRLGEHLGFKIEAEKLPDLSLLKQPGYKAPMATLQISGGKKNKIRPGDIVGALTQSKEITGDDLGKIKVAANWSYIAVTRKFVDNAFRQLTDGKIKGRKYRVKRIS
ncbi:ATP-dependent RNA helicase DbpA [Kangiella sp. HZ709]|uniref:ATP-dependent RNA helicase DbpA n=1 Tax=Kangiella sp. HZ709 TaxID=2666328 RepID=UPI0012B11AEA|nr:ATP-dependent RNA helicase DbpA [Kangiella sp. HZ709]MRX26705.1 ATP-dependent RNA helicase DbpA [Kangiella sp. HZ709]